ncbi:large conductance mechanosensitive channel protein MscL [Planctomicrobium sp. SH664]|uniref:large conductance mechanosensitive channel protein MscL n=1 Tax=Planctomicrobium sp. SH664 TaxID=3448125 RepID=UPI003F5BC3D5
MSILSDFKKFALRGNLIDMTVGFTVGAAFTTIAKSLVTDIVMPPIGLALGRTDFSNLFWTISTKEGSPGPFNSIQAANAAGAVTINYGLFLNSLITFAMITVVMFLLIRLMNRLEEKLEYPFGGRPKEDEPSDKKCPFCISTIPYKATRCPNCTSELSAAST